MDQPGVPFAAVLEGSRQLSSALAGTAADPMRRGKLVAEALHGMCHPQLAACLIKGSAKLAVSSAPSPPWAAAVAKQLESWAQDGAELTDVSLPAASPGSVVLCGQRIRNAKTTYGILALAVQPTERDSACAALAWAAELLALRLRVEELEGRHSGDKEPVGRVDLAELTGIVTHQFNNILNDIVLQLAVLERRNLPEETRAEAVAIRQRSQQAAGLVKELQRHGRSFHAQPAPVDLNSIVRSALESLCAAPVEDGTIQWSLPTGKHLKLVLDQAPGLPPVLGLAPDLTRLLGLLLHSSAAALRGDGETIHVRTRLDESGCQLLVEDSGPGVAADMLPRLFEPFTVVRQGDDGLGLAVCRGLARRMQANLRGDNRAGGGMVFTVGFAQVRK